MGPLRGHLEAEARAVLPGGLQGLFECRPRAPLRALPGRETFLWPEGEEASLVIKRFGGDPLGERLRERLRGRGRSPGRREYENLLALREAGIPMPRPLGWGEAGADSLLVMARVPHRDHLRDRLLAGEEPRPWVERLVPLVVRLHRSGWYHRDLYLQHWIEGPAGPVLLDAGRARWERAPRRRWWIKDLAALWHSTPACVGERTALRFLAAYFRGMGIGERGARRRWAREILARERRMAAHAPRHDRPEVER